MTFCVGWIADFAIDSISVLGYLQRFLGRTIYVSLCLVGSMVVMVVSALFGF